MTPPITITSTAATSSIAAYKSWVVSASKATYKGKYTLTLTAKHGTKSLSSAQSIVLHIVDQCDSPAVNKPTNPGTKDYTVDGSEKIYPLPTIAYLVSEIHEAKKIKSCKLTY